MCPQPQQQQITDFNNEYAMNIVDEKIGKTVSMFTKDARMYFLLNSTPRLGKQGTHISIILLSVRFQVGSDVKVISRKLCIRIGTIYFFRT